ncbi:MULTISPECIES: TetR/AcrR family transcriptional regulator C-terminal domain-containing protein [Gordonia]|uniref:TetR family transcriptional regulator n=1 Tax=Gordonia jacobaea TaxID=122202 RepID=A0ABR5I8X8_9ACTN|nr:MULTISPECIES: TetR/AcrR family transcriptional regulator C-terminal domain-containing protein [Gordonia]KNA90083.1 TetR family transcriptional regulator [Gordonia jacobaea]OBC08621.1 TetR family transcriptional regulator [Gordonia sp. 852002-50395_SCH5434458]OBC10365.1 TetR family transcriptional regulator [Gordonia sp. 852002-50816_SCH5313054-a]OBC20302.1 TetR family transcriptional regulator [Gordonia sp. 852002-50816_SCH5313054-c]
MPTGRPKGLNRADIVQAALDLLDEKGIDAVTVRAVATRLGVKAPALYWHVENKQALLDEMGTEIQRRVIAELRAQPMGVWPESVATYARVLRREYLAHRDGARTFSGTRLTDPEVLRAQEPWLEQLVASGVDLERAVSAVEFVTAFVVGFVIEEQERAQSGEPRYSLSDRTEMLGDDVPLVVEAGRVLFGDREQRFERNLDGIVDALRRATT